MPDTKHKSSILKTLWAKTTTKFVAITSFLAALAVLLTNLKSLRDTSHDLLGASKGLKIVDIAFTTVDDAQYFDKKDPKFITDGDDTLDIKFRNDGDVVFLKKIEIKIKKYWEFRYDERSDFSQIMPSATYLMRIPIDPHKIPYTVTKDISHEVKQGATERIFLALRSENKNDNAFAYDIDLSFIYNEDNKRITKEDILLAFQLPGQHYYDLEDYRSGDSKTKEIYERNLKCVNELNSINGIRSKTVVQLIKKVQREIE